MFDLPFRFALLEKERATRIRSGRTPKLALPAHEVHDHRQRVGDDLSVGGRTVEERHIGLCQERLRPLRN